jgi:gliding motility-associated-like protein
LISGMLFNTCYTVTAGNGSCTSNPSICATNLPILVTPAVPTITTTPPTCLANGSSTISNYVSTLIYTFAPTGPTVGTGGLISGMTVATNYTVTAGNGTCTSAATIPFKNSILLTPPIPLIGTVTQPTCLVATGSFTITNFNTAYTYTVTPSAGTSISATGVVTAPSGSYTVIATQSACPSLPSLPVVINSVPTSVTAPLFGTVTQPTCSVTTGSFAITNYNSGYIYSFNPTGPTISPTGIVTASAGSYILTATQGTCAAGISNPVIINIQPSTPSVPTSLLQNDKRCAEYPIQTIKATAIVGASESLVWYDSAVNGNIVSNPILNTIGSVTYYAQANNTSCTSTRLPVTLTLEYCSDPCDIVVNNVLTPGDEELGLNDIFKINGLQCYPVNNVEIFNRWGVLVYEADGYDNGNVSFKGYSNGRVLIKEGTALPAGTYFYVLKYTKTDGTAIDKAGYLYLQR